MKTSVMPIPVNLYKGQGGLWAPASYWALPRHEVEQLYNGMGPKGFGAIVPDTFWGLSMTEAGNIHDHMYGEEQVTRQLADIILLVNCIVIIETESKSRILRWLRRRRAMTYFCAVADFGKWFRKTREVEQA